MVKRTRSQFKTDDLAFPIRLKLAVPPGGMRSLDVDTHAWLKENLAPLAWAWGPAQGIGTAAAAYYFRDIEDARRFIAAFPQLALADGVASGHYTSPAMSAGSRLTGGAGVAAASIDCGQKPYKY